ncbi:basic salivary proline-rich protein 2-like isoform X2 [Oenanthe melanoleuca]|uniref:basic salivary proline-rich protein 2-like isoform X2 n=1 Tax=Oenanthe melanoleuca TaxID=2939378 RepID=UPI0024C1FC68|nr:basic salivary proline-rich protein 2-like isoform X2 [Oenanthe melanoleuca]
MGCGRMSPALLLLLCLASCSLLQGLLLRPRRVRLEAQNFHVQLHWEPEPSSPSCATHQVEWRSRTSSWTKAGACGGNSSSSCVCKLYFENIYEIYWARVRVVAGGEQSEWASSSELQLYRDTIVGPPKLSWQLQDQMLSVKIITPPTPYRRRSGSYKRVSRVLMKLWYWLHLYEGELLVQQVSCEWSSEEQPCTLGHLRPSTHYCVRTVAVGIARERSREAEGCLLTPAPPAGFPWLPATLSAASLLLLLSVAGLCFVRLQLLAEPPETRLPKALNLQHRGLSVAGQVPPLQPEEDPLALLLQTVLPSQGPPTAGQAPATVPQLPRGLAPDEGGYCANGFGPDCPEVRDPSCSHSQLGLALGPQVPSEPKDGEAGDGDDLPEQLALVELTGSSCLGDRDSQTPEMWLPLRPQLYSKCQCPVPGAGRDPPVPVPSRSCGQELRQSLGRAGRWVPLGSVRLPASAHEEGGQPPCAPQTPPGMGTEPEPPCAPQTPPGMGTRPEPPCARPTPPGRGTRPEPGVCSGQRGCWGQAGLPVPPSPCGPAASSGYEPRAPVALSHGQGGAPSPQHGQDTSQSCPATPAPCPSPGWAQGTAEFRAQPGMGRTQSVPLGVWCSWDTA